MCEGWGRGDRGVNGDGDDIHVDGSDSGGIDDDGNVDSDLGDNSDDDRGDRDDDGDGDDIHVDGSDSGGIDDDGNVDSDLGDNSDDDRGDWSDGDDIHVDGSDSGGIDDDGDADSDCGDDDDEDVKPYKNLLTIKTIAPSPMPHKGSKRIIKLALDTILPHYYPRMNRSRHEVKKSTKRQ